MKNVMRRARRALTASALAAVTVVLGTSASGVCAQGWPNKPITRVVPFPPGGGTDAFARPLSAQLTKQLGKQMIIDSRGGAGGTVGASIAAKAPPDGYAFFIGAVHHTIAPSFYTRLDYGSEVTVMKQDEVAPFVRNEIIRWSAVTGASGAELD
jgi:tripartite-type tricarboxylate transporter receptor subunit TctC